MAYTKNMQFSVILVQIFYWAYFTAATDTCLSGNYLIAIALTTTTTEFISPLSLKIYNHTGSKAQAGYSHEITHRRKNFSS